MRPQLLAPVCLSLFLAPPLARSGAGPADTPPAADAAPASRTSATPPLDKQSWYLDEKIERQFGYASAVRVGDTLHVSGIPASGDMASALERVYRRLSAVLAAHGLDHRHVVKETLFATNIDAVVANIDVRKRFYKGETPAASWVQVERLVVPQAVLEVEVTAVFPKPAHPVAGQ